MAGIFTHLAIVRSIYADPNRLSAVSELTPDIRFALQFRSNFVDLGAISPDCPYFHVLDSDENAISWAEVMHYWRTGDFIREAIAWLRGKNYIEAHIQKTIAWLFGYASHVITDLTVHPIVELRVGKYATNKAAHRTCELHQDVYTFFHTLGIDATEANYLKGAGLKSCTNNPYDPKDHRLHSSIAELWKHCCSTVKPSLKEVDYVFGRIPNESPQPETWFRWFCEMIDKGAENGCRIPILFPILMKYGFALPGNRDSVDMSYISNLKVPGGGRADFPEIFEMAINNTVKYWGELAAALRTELPEIFSLVNGNLDSGRAYETDALIFWNESRYA